MPSPEEQRTKKSAKRRGKALRSLAWASCIFNLLALVCIILLLVAGQFYVQETSQTVPASGDGSEISLSWTIFALVQFTYNIAGTTPTVLWYFNSLGWVDSVEPELASAANVYSAAAQTLRFPDIVPSIVDSLNETIGSVWENCTDVHPDYENCPRILDPAAIDAFDDAPAIAVPTAPALLFIAITLVLVLVQVPLEFGPLAEAREKADISWRRCQPRWQMIFYGVQGALGLSHLIAAASLTGAAERVRSYLADSPSLHGVVTDVSLGSGLLLLVWLGFLATLLARAAHLGRDYLGRRWKTLLELGAALELMEIREEDQRRRARARQRQRAAVPPVVRAPSEHASIRTALPEYEEVDQESGPKAPAYEEITPESSRLAAERSRSRASEEGEE